MWVYFSGESLKPLYGVILVDNLEPDIALENLIQVQVQTLQANQKHYLKQEKEYI